MLGDSCTPDWYTKNEECPHGSRLPGDVTVPRDWGFFEGVAIFYSMLPFLIVVVNVLELFWRRGTRQLALLTFVGLSSLTNEFLVKPFIQQQRPVGSCAIKCGMPSSHATYSMGMMMFLVLDGIFRVVPSKHELAGQLIPMRESLARRSEKQWFSTTPIPPGGCLTHIDFAIFNAIWFAFLMPVPLMRVKLHDHSVEQVFVGSALGCIYAIIWFCIMTSLSRRYSSQFKRPFLYLFKHDYRPPKFRVKIEGKEVEGAEIVEPSDISTRSMIQLTEESSRKHSCCRHTGSNNFPEISDERLTNDSLTNDSNFKGKVGSNVSRTGSNVNDESFPSKV